MFRYPAAIGILALSSGCATLSEPAQQEVLVQTIQDHRQQPGAGCLLANGAGKWFVTTPGRVTIQKSGGPLQVDCLKAGAGWASETIEPAIATAVLGNLANGGVGLLVDHFSGAGYDYPATLTIVMRKIGEPAPPAPARKPAGVERAPADPADPAGP